MLLVSDAAVLLAIVLGVQVVSTVTAWPSASWQIEMLGVRIPSYVTSTVVVALWLAALGFADSRSARIAGAGATEYLRVVDASFRLFGAIAIAAFLGGVDLSRGYLLICFPAGTSALVLARWLWRQWLVRKRATGEFSARVLLAGSAESVRQVERELRRFPSAGYHVVGACVTNRSGAVDVRRLPVPVLGGIDDVERALVESGADTVAVTSTDDLPPDRVKQISWGLEAGRQHLVLAPSIVDIAGPRLHTRPVAGLPLIHVETPRFSRGQRVVKRSADLVASCLGLLVLAPMMAAIALVIRATSPGDALFRQTRVGRDGRVFTMYKFRTMVSDAESLLATLDSQRDAGNEVLFKIRADPRVTRVGRFLRKYSLDELPQLLNVVLGSMSLVGPRPPLPTEVAQYATHVHRRFLVRPGITGLWQVSGRSALSWEDSVRLDLSYVENWTLVGDLVILLKTVRAAATPGDTSF